MGKCYKGKFIAKNPNKYMGNSDNIIYRSSWELRVFYWCDSSEEVLAWSSEEVVVPYVCPIDQQVHRYFVDFKIVFKSGKTILVELKPESQTRAPKALKPGKKVTKTYMEALMTWERNKSKWNHARMYAKKRNWSFMIWTEKTLNMMGIKILQK